MKNVEDRLPLLKFIRCEVHQKGMLLYSNVIKTILILGIVQYCYIASQNIPKGKRMRNATADYEVSTYG